ncbi:hypothetical protein JOQ06_028645 [Pogonophryne albipinna]|uniref:Uncharacterized protein n=1 Tax=Pogonophryne albipinna TaxID=1090488 RepID=A0AAD6B984_9TELE|nr:hypothetical protein JOQ06_028645 [Pogonophryne albipinna]
MGRKTKKSDINDSDGGGEEGCELASHASNNSAHGEVGNQALSLSDIQKLLTGMEERIIGSLTAQMTSNHAAIIRHDETIQAIETSMNDFQGRITVESTLADIVYLSEVRVPRPTTFIESFLAEIFGPDCLHHFQMKQRIMQLAREKGPLMYRGAEIHICGLQCRSSQEESRIYPHQVHAEKHRARFQPPLTR